MTRNTHNRRWTFWGAHNIINFMSLLLLYYYLFISAGIADIIDTYDLI